MISRYNWIQSIKAMLLMVGGVVCCGLAFLFFSCLTIFLARQFRYPLPPMLPLTIGLVGVAAAWLSGYLTWKRRGGFFG